MPNPIRILTVTVTAVVFLQSPKAAAAPSDPPGAAAVAGDVPAPVRTKTHARPPARSIGEQASPSAVPARPPAERPAEPALDDEEPAAPPDDDEEVSPGDDPASCDGCELAGFSWAGTLWGLFGVSRRRRVPRTVIRGLQPR